MPIESQLSRKDLDLRVRGTDPDNPKLVDEIGVELLDHLIVCRTCFAIFAAQKRSLEEVGCVEGRRIVLQSKVKWHERRVDLHRRHQAEKTLDNCIFWAIHIRMSSGARAQKPGSRRLFRL